MKPVAIVIVVAAFAVATLAATAKTVTTSDSTHERMVAGVAGPIAAATSQHKMRAAKKTKAKADMAVVKPQPISD